MPAKDLGTKYCCFKCQTKFYDMKKPDPICPKCGADQRESPALKPPSESRRGRLAVAKAAAPEPEETKEEGSLLGEDEEEIEDVEEEEAESIDDEEV